MLKTKSVHSPIEPADGLSILTSRFRGRGLRQACEHVLEVGEGINTVAAPMAQTSR